MTIRVSVSEHAAKRLRQRRIERVWIERTVNDPTETESDMIDGALVHALRSIPERGFRVLRVIYNDTTEPVTIVTAFFDDSIKHL